jgi:23S rRNA (cytidine1920-2'-O)/16S rRNA (cytidine1409-2'-O)-methyltransferase
LVPSRERAREVIARGEVSVSGAPALKASRLVAADEPVVVAGPPARFVGRGGDKLDAALEQFGIDLNGCRVLDAGASTGGFTDCALQRGAERVIAVDVGRGQLHHRLRTDPRVEVHERTNVRHLAPGDLGPPVDVVVADLSFISLRTVAPALVALARPGADLVWLVKPQFEAGRAEASRHRGVIGDPVIWRRVLEEVAAALGAQRAAIMGVMASPITGADGNVEFLVHGRVAACSDGDVDVDAMIDAALEEAPRR